MAARKPVLCGLINEPINSKSTAMDASIIAIIYFHLLCVNCLDQLAVLIRVKSLLLC